MASRYSRSSELRLDRKAGTATLRASWFLRKPREESRPLASLQDAAFWRGFSMVTLMLIPRWIVHRESTNQEAIQVLKQWEEQLRAFLRKEQA